MGHPGHGTRPCSWLLAGTSRDVPGNPRYTWDIWDTGQGLVAGFYLAGTSRDVPGNPRYTWDIWDMGQGHVQYAPNKRFRIVTVLQ